MMSESYCLLGLPFGLILVRRVRIWLWRCLLAIPKSLPARQVSTVYQLALISRFVTVLRAVVDEDFFTALNIFILCTVRRPGGFPPIL